MMKKGFTMGLEEFVKIILTLILVFLVFKIGEKIAYTFGGSNAPKELENFVKELDLLPEGETKESFIMLDPDMALIGFSKTIDEFRCYGCFQDRETYSTQLLYYFRKKPIVSECKDQACVCLCLEDFGSSNAESGNKALTCKKTFCRPLIYDISPRISLEGPTRFRKITMLNYPYWENGFFFVRSSNADFPSNGINPSNQENKQLVCIGKKRLNNEVYVGAYPAPCLE